ncbi:hypothetical protein DRQ09_10590, partial [candidate division KSB1 bacterium]
VLKWSNSGEKLYNENLFYLGAGLKLTDRFAIGFGGKYKKIDISQYSSIGKTTFDTGISFIIKQNFLFELLSENVWLKDEDYFLSRLNVGLKSFISRNLILKCGVVKEKDFPPEYFIESIYTFKRVLQFHSGGSLNPDFYLFGLSYKTEKIILGYIFTEHQVLGLSHRFYFVYNFSSRNGS